MAVISAQQAGGIEVPFFMDLIAWSEGTSTEDITQNDGYDVIVTGEILDASGTHFLKHEEVFTDYSDHPFAGGRSPVLVRPGEHPLYSTASGRYQALLHEWMAYKRILELSDFGPLSQDIFALRLMKERNAVASILAGDIQEAIFRCSSAWASLPGNSYGQGGRSLDALLVKWTQLVSPSSTA